MLTHKFHLLSGLAAAMTLVSCATTSPEVVVETPVPKPEESKVPEPAVPEVLQSKPPSEILIPPMLNMPSDGEFRASNPALPKPGDSGAVISRPPMDPPSRVKPKEGE